ncbi:MAG: hypothetical protein IKS16_02330, partial [Lachnospiraceae bacterium]|nr:hypothetical protein [Lachnospiraceae bacterium]
MNDKYLTYGYLDDEGDFYVRLYCVDPSDNLRECMGRGVSSILFSATLLPIQYYKSLLGGGPEDYEVYAESTFDRRRRALFLADDVTTKYTERGRDQYERIAAHIKAITDARPGKYMAFFPSYGFMENVLESYCRMYSGKIPADTSYGIFDKSAENHKEDGMITTVGNARLLVQNSRMTEEERERFLAAFAGTRDEIRAAGDEDGGIDAECTPGSYNTLIGFCVLGGIFSEGIDLQGESLIGSIIVGTGIPMVCEENELIKHYFDMREDMGDGMKYAYIYPGFNKVLQAAGRVIRTHEDTGIVALLDQRFAYSSYRELYPREWSTVVRINIRSVTGKVKAFWDNITEIH